MYYVHYVLRFYIGARYDIYKQQKYFETFFDK